MEVVVKQEDRCNPSDAYQKSSIRVPGLTGSQRCGESKGPAVASCLLGVLDVLDVQAEDPQQLQPIDNQREAR